jgi:hypothetical protein
MLFLQLTADFLSPVTPNDLVRQSLPYSYLSVNVVANDGAAHDVRLYTDITAEWASNDWDRSVTWSSQTLNNSLLVHQVGLTNPVIYGEAADSTLYGEVVYATDTASCELISTHKCALTTPSVREYNIPKRT